MSQSTAASLKSSTRYCAVFGKPVRHSASPAMHNAAFSFMGLNWAYLALEVDPVELGPAIAGAKATGFLGLNLTVPHKHLAMELVDVATPSAKEWGAVNTIVFEGRNSSREWRPLREFDTESPREIRSAGYNTDAYGLARSLGEDLGFQINGSRAVILGAGGAGQAAALKFASEGAAELFLVNRTVEKADILANDIRRRFPSVRVHVGYPVGRDRKMDLILNATSLGLKPEDPLPLDLGKIRLANFRAVYDMIYRPAETPLLAEAKAAGCAVANGLGMLLHQGAGALELWTGKPAPLPVMREALVRNIYGT